MTMLHAPAEAVSGLREAIAPHLSLFNSAGDIGGFIVITIGHGAYEMRTDLSSREAEVLLLSMAAKAAAA